MLTIKERLDILRSRNLTCVFSLCCVLRHLEKNIVFLFFYFFESEIWMFEVSGFEWFSPYCFVLYFFIVNFFWVVSVNECKLLMRNHLNLNILCDLFIFCSFLFYFFEILHLSSMYNKITEMRYIVDFTVFVFWQRFVAEGRSIRSNYALWMLFCMVCIVCSRLFLECVCMVY